jgi:hypothetical protein
MPNVATAQPWACASDLIVARLTIDTMHFGHTVPWLISISDKERNGGCQRARSFQWLPEKCEGRRKHGEHNEALEVSIKRLDLLISPNEYKDVHLFTSSFSIHNLNRFEASLYTWASNTPSYFPILIPHLEPPNMMLPEKDDVIFFPRQVGELVKIAWYQNNQYCQAEYYRTPAYVFKQTNKLSNGRPMGEGFRVDNDTKCEKLAKTSINLQLPLFLYVYLYKGVTN